LGLAYLQLQDKNGAMEQYEGVKSFV
jgi:hypothetical protein